MPGACSYDLRKKAMEALDEGESRTFSLKDFYRKHKGPLGPLC